MKMKIFVTVVLLLTLINKIAVASNDVRITITSYERSAKEQAIIIKRDYHKGVNLKALYKNKEVIKELLTVVNKKNALTRMEYIIVKYSLKGVYLSRHLCGQALDISKKGKGVKSFIAFMKNVDDVEILNEGDHYHIQTQKDCVQ